MNARTVMAAVLAVLIAVSLGMAASSDTSDAAGSEAETIGETMEFTAGEVYELDGRSLVFTGEGRLVFQALSVLSVNGSTHLEGSGTIITLMQGAVVSYMGTTYAVPQTMDVGLRGSADLVIDMDLMSAIPSGSFSMDISDGGEIEMLGGVTRGGPGIESEARVGISGDAIVMSMSMDIPYTSGTLEASMLSQLFPGVEIPFESVGSEMTGMSFEMSMSAVRETSP